MKAPYFFGIDIGTQGCRTVLIDVQGHMLGWAEESFSISDLSLQEQSPDEWWQAAVACLKSTIHAVKGIIHMADIKAISVTSTSGTVIPVDKNFRPLHPAIMYSDKRSEKEGELCRYVSHQYNASGYTGFNSSSGLSKMIWYQGQYPEMTSRIHKWLHATDYIIGKLCDVYDVTDCTNVLKSGYDLLNDYWPDYLFDHLRLQREWMPTVIAPGKPITTLQKKLARELGFTHSIEVVSGMTDGCASQIASGAASPGDWNTTIGTTLVVKGITVQSIQDPERRIYNHRHPEGYWMPGGASNIGAGWVTKSFGRDLATLDHEARKLIPTKWLSYPLEGTGERFPFIAPSAVGFEPEGVTDAQRFASGMEGVAYIERFAYELITRLSGEPVFAVYTAGGGSNSDTWRKIRANVLNRPVYKMKNVTGAIGAAILAASQTYFGSLTEATKSICQLESEIVPERNLADAYAEQYLRFIQILKGRGYIESGTLC